MAPLVEPWQAGQELAACLCLGAAAGALRSLAPPKGRSAVLPDILLVGLLLILLQSYAAGFSAAGGLRWYMLAGGGAGAAAAQALLTPVVQRIFWLAGLPVRAAAALGHRAAAKALAAAKVRSAARVKRKNQKKEEKRQIKIGKKTLPKEPQLMYNSNV